MSQGAQDRRGSLSSALGVIAVNAAVLLALLGLLEGGARLLEGGTTRPLFEDEQVRTRGRPFVVPHPKRGFALMPGFSDGRYQIDERGFRHTPGATAAQEAPLWIALGESTTFGWGVADAQSYPAQLARLSVAAGAPLRVINAGVPSYSSSQVLRYLEELLPALAPEGVLVSIMWNDIWYSTVLNWYPELLVYQQPAGWLTRLMARSALVRLLLLEPLPEQTAREDRFNAAALEQYTQNLRAMLELAARQGVQLAFVEPPFAPARMPDEGLNEFHIRYSKPFFLQTAAQYREAVRSLAAQFGAPVLDHRLSLQQGGGDPALFIDLLHPSAEGNRLLAADVLRGLLCQLQPERASQAGCNCDTAGSDLPGTGRPPGPAGCTGARPAQAPTTGTGSPGTYRAAESGVSGR